MHKGIHSPTSQNPTKMKSGKGQSSMSKQHSSRRMVHSASTVKKSGSMKGGY